MEQVEDIESMIFTALGLLIGVNVGFIIYTIVEICKEKRHVKAREQRRIKWEAAWKEIEKNKPSRFQKPREYDGNEVPLSSLQQEEEKG